MKRALLFACFAAGGGLAAAAQTGGMTLPASVTAGAPFTIPTTGNGKAELLLIGPGGALRRDVELGQPVSLAAGDIYNAGRYLVLLKGSSGNQIGAVEVLAASQPETLSFLARPSRLPVGLRGGVSGTVYLFDAYHNLITAPTPVSFQLATPGGTPQAKTMESRNGVAWTQLDSAPREGAARFIAEAGGVASTRVIEEVPGDPCGLTMSARADGRRVALETNPVKDCSGNPVPDGTIVTFTESYGGMQSTIDAPLKQGIARAEMPSVAGAKISVASGVVAGNEIRWGGGR